MKKGLTCIVAILDKSGSMADVRYDALGGINTFIEDQKKAPGEAIFTLVLFDTTVKTIYDQVDIKLARTLTESEYIPSNGTALLKAISDTVDFTGAKLAAMKEEDRPEKVIVCVVTDGQENSSNLYSNIEYDKWCHYPTQTTLIYTKAKLNEKIKHQEEVYNWKFVYLSADNNAFVDAQGMGFSPSMTRLYSAANTADTYKSISDAICTYRSTGQIDQNDLDKVK